MLIDSVVKLRENNVSLIPLVIHTRGVMMFPHTQALHNLSGRYNLNMILFYHILWQYTGGFRKLIYIYYSQYYSSEYT